MLLKSKSSLDVQCSSQWSKASTVIQLFLFILYRHDCLGQLFIESDRMPKIKRNCFGWFPPKQKKAQYSPEKETEREREGEEGERETDRTIQHSLKSCQNLILLKTNLSLILLRNFFMRDILWRWRSRQLDEKRKINLRVQKYQL